MLFFFIIMVVTVLAKLLPIVFSRYLVRLHILVGGRLKQMAVVSMFLTKILSYT